LHTILLFGAGKSATVLINYLIAEAAENDWHIVIADVNREAVLHKTGGAASTTALGLDIHNTAERQSVIKTADIVISLMPPSLHHLIAGDCILFAKNLLTASYVDDALRSREKEISDKGLLFLCEMGLDPGIDHMSAMELICRIKANGGSVDSFMSHCGGLVAPESDNNPWRYKISWNPRNVVLAGKAGAIFRKDGQIVNLSYHELFADDHTTEIDDTIGKLGYYPNRDSISYIQLYGLEQAHTFIRTTLRYPDFISGWRHIIRLGLTDETVCYDTDGLTLGAFFQQFFAQHGYDVLLPSIHHSNTMQTLVSQLHFLGTRDDNTLINKGRCSAADVLQFVLEQKLMLLPADKDMVVMQHDIVYRRDGQLRRVLSNLIVKGEDALKTAMAKTVGLPLGIAAKLILNGTITTTGLQIPIIPDIYKPVLAELAANGIVFTEKETELSN
jgi:saccharopine dehydrogenase-like NADP-dependent oxidoreductase